nr:unnamed protein product [Callosobruchus analis]
MLKMFFDILSRVLTTANEKYIVLCGDFNIDYNAVCLDTMLLKDTFECFDLYVTTSDPTRIFTYTNGSKTSSAIDHLAINIDRSLCKTVIFNPNIADHFGHLFETKWFASSLNAKETVKLKFRNLGMNNINQFKTMVSQIDWHPLYQLELNDSYSYLIDSITWCLESSCPEKTVTKIICDQKATKNWMNDSLAQQGQLLKELFWLKTHFTSPHLLELYNEEKRHYRNNLVQAKNDYYAGIIRGSSNKSKAVWRVINYEIGRVKKSPDSIVLNIDGKAVSDETHLSNIFASTFSQGVPNGIKAHFSYNLSLPPISPLRNDVSIFIRPVPKDDINDILLNIKNKNTSGFDELSVSLLHHIKEHLLDHIVYLTNKSLCNACFPDILKLAILIPVFKKGHCSEIDNYRQISLLSVFSKILVKFFYTQLYSFITNCNILSVCQHGFQAKKSVETASCHYLDFIYSQLDKRKSLYSLIFDISKAFDRVWHEGLLAKLAAYGLPPGLLQWLNSFLNDRSLFVVVEGCSSDVFPINAGVPQGSVLSPTLFLLYINELLEITSNPVYSFADDSTLVSCMEPGKPLHPRRLHVCGTITPLRSTQISGRSLSGLVNKVQFNVQKTQTTTLTRKSLVGLPSVEMEGRPMVESPAVKLLGINISNNMSWHDHVVSIAKTASQKLGVLFRCRKLYAAAAVQGADPTIVGVLRNRENRAVRLIDAPNLTRDLDSLEHRRRVAALSLFYRFYHGRCSRELSQIITPKAVRKKYTREALCAHPYQVEVATPRTSLLQHSFFWRTSTPWNELPGNLFPDDYSLQRFKTNVHRHLSSRSASEAP